MGELEPAGEKTVQVADFRGRIGEFERVLRGMPGALSALPLAHHFATGVYVRELFIPANTHLVGEVHRYDCLNIVFGDIEVATEEGLKRLTGLNVFPSSAGVKRAGRTFSATVWFTVHANPSDEHDGEQMAARLTVPSFDELEGLAPHLPASKG
jgi:hypothetical protein